MSDSTATSGSTADAAASGDQSTRIALVEDHHAGELLTLRRAAFVSEAQVYGDPNIPPLTQTLPELREDMARDDVVTIGAWDGHRLVGSIRVEISGERATLGRLAVAPDQQGRGMGTTLLFAILEFLPEQISEIWAFTGKDSRQNLALYAKHGYEAQYDEAAGQLTYTYLRRVLHAVDSRRSDRSAASPPAGRQ
ncbi:GNAT family N-acetyltransferase [Isoptericola aurantiacus]|uniref:GNAT family N-acetyltransferase n=1 Tax=Isoptericola aurantiacus TaxID=3377839 RepID=UPI00383A8102